MTNHDFRLPIFFFLSQAKFYSNDKAVPTKVDTYGDAKDCLSQQPLYLYLQPLHTHTYIHIYQKKMVDDK